MDAVHSVTVDESLRRTITRPGWAISVMSPAPGVVQTRATGRVERACIEPLVEVYEIVAAKSAPVVVFHDWEGISGYTSETRQALVEWSMRHDGTVERAHILVGSKLVAMGVSVASLLLPKLVSYSVRNDFERERTATIAAHRRRQ